MPELDVPVEPIDLAGLSASAPGTNELVLALQTVIDPELGVDIVNLGLVYGAQVVEGVAHVLMTTTTPACPIGSYLIDQIHDALRWVPGIVDVDVELTHDPPWKPERMSESAKRQLGWAR